IRSANDLKREGPRTFRVLADRRWLQCCDDSVKPGLPPQLESAPSIRITRKLFSQDLDRYFSLQLQIPATIHRLRSRAVISCDPSEVRMVKGMIRPRIRTMKVSSV